MAEEISICDLLEMYCSIILSYCGFLNHRQEASLRRTTPLHRGRSVEHHRGIGTESLYLSYCLSSPQESYLELLDFILSKCVRSCTDFQFCEVFGNENEYRIT